MELLIVGGRFDGFAQTFTKSARFKRGPQSSHLFLPWIVFLGNNVLSSMDFEKKKKKYFCKRGRGALPLLQIIWFLPENTPKNIKTKKLFAHICGFTDFECGFDFDH